MTENTSRRRFLKVAAATGALAGLNATVLAQGQDETVIVLGGKTSAWQGYRVPGEATEEVPDNPTLNLQTGTTYTLLWQNVDGQPHNFAIQDSQGNNLEVLEPLSVPSDVYEEANGTDAGESISLNVSGGNVTGVSTGNMTGNMTGGEPASDSLVGKTEIISEQGAVQGARFTATEEMATYICLVHPNTMVGEVALEGGDGGMGNNSSS
ncbi:twin-arginine translocation signal domain-containing protein [Halorussus lipolyticus]|uniref:twin-arginine translocation signal domain-containing protein n=1 Tax=Halorussus lipolyticus TaxID=3034024 RepID=UPI0023E8D0F0|nr:twin-arginine translocation signal domain-containing protein [Halorussus sp. DT80]